MEPVSYLTDAVRSPLLLLLFAGLAVGCWGDITGPESVSSLSVSPASPRLTALGVTVDLEAIPKTADGGTVSGVELTWTSRDPEVVSVDGSGTVTALSAGTGTIGVSVTNGDAVETVDVVVDPSAVSIRVHPENALLNSESDTMQLRSVGTDRNGNDFPTVAAWSIRDSAVAVVEARGDTVAAIARSSGQSVIFAEVDGVADTIPVSVPYSVEDVESVDVSPSTSTLTALGATVDLEGYALTTSGDTASRMPLTWRSEDTAVAAVSDSGVVTARSRGDAQITVSVGDSTPSATASVTVDPEPAVVEVTPDSVGFDSAGESTEMSVSVRDRNDNLLGEVAAWSSTDVTVASVADSGRSVRVQAEGDGRTQVVASVDGVVDSVPVTVGNLNLEARSLFLTPRGVLVGDTVSGIAVVANTGQTDVAAAEWTLTSVTSGTEVARGTTGPLAAGAVDTLDLGSTDAFTLNGRDSLRFVLDPADELAETNDQDDRAIGQLVVRPDGFDMELNFVGAVHDTAVYRSAVSFWENVVTGDLEDVVPNGWDVGHYCFDDEEQLPLRDEPIDDHALYVREDRLDGPVESGGSRLGYAGFCFYRTGTSERPPMPVIGYVTVDSADIDYMRENDKLRELIDHEIGHTLGIGLWNFQDGEEGPWQLRVGSATDDPRYVGAYAVQKYRALGGTGHTIPVANRGGDGTEDVHWRASEFMTELMSGYIVDGSNPLSAITIASLADQFYAVDMSAAEPFTVSSTESTLKTEGADDGRIRLGPHFMVEGKAVGVNDRGQIVEVRDRGELRGAPGRQR